MSAAPSTKKQKTQPTLEAGAASVDITPAVGIDVTGMDDGPSTGINDSLFAKCVVFRCAGKCVVILTLDLLGIELVTTRQIRQRISRRLQGVEPGDVMIVCAHNHCGPSILDFYGDESDIHPARVDKAYKARALDAMVDVAAAAFAALVPATLCVGSTSVYNVGGNRRARLDDGSLMYFKGKSSYDERGSWRGRAPPEGRYVVETSVIDPQLSVLGVTDAATGRYIAVLTNFATHCWLYACMLISADISGACSAYVEEQLRADHPGVVALYCPGTGSDITTVQNQKYPEGGYPDNDAEREKWFGPELSRFGGILGRATLEALKGAGPKQGSCGAHVGSTCYPLAAPAYDGYLRDLLNARRGTADEGTLPPASQTMATEVQVVELGEAVRIIGLPSEVYVEYGLEIKARSKFECTFVFSYCNDYFADIVTLQAVEEGLCPELEWAKVHPGVRQLIMARLAAHGLFRCNKGEGK